MQKYPQPTLSKPPIKFAPPPPFKFKNHNMMIDWKAVKRVEIERIIKTSHTAPLEVFNIKSIRIFYL